MTDENYDWDAMMQATRGLGDDAAETYDADTYVDQPTAEADDDDGELTDEEVAVFGTFMEGSRTIEEAISKYEAYEARFESKVARSLGVTEPQHDSDLEYEDAVDLWYDARGLEDVRDVVQNYVDAATAAGSDDPWSDGEAAFHRANEVLADEATRKGHKTRPGTFEDAIDAAYQDGSIGPKAAPKQQSAARRRQSSAANAIDDWAVSDLAPANELRKQARRAINHKRRQNG